MILVVLLVYFISAIYIKTPEIGDQSALKLQRSSPAPGIYTIGNNWLKKNRNGLYEMYLEGDAFERGVINGKLTKELAENQETVFINQIKQLVPNESYLNFLKYFVAYFNRHLPDHIPTEYQEEIYGVSLGASDKFDKLAPKYYRILNYHSAHDIGHALQDKNMTVGCTSFGVWDKKTEDGKLLLGRNFDFFAGEDFAENKIVCFTNPSQGHKFMYVTWAGFTGVVSGMNDKGLTVTINAAKSEIPKSAATPISLLAREILQYAGNIKEAYAIAEKRKTFVSESILIGSAADHRTAIIEKTPSKTNLYSEKGDQLICSNHFRSEMFSHDFDNNKNMVESSSLYRKFRMQELLSEETSFTPQDVARVLRDQDGIKGNSLGMGNEKAMNQLLAHHAIIFKPEERLVWVSSNPYQLGKFTCYDLNKVFSEYKGLKENKEIAEQDLEIPADPFLTTKYYHNFVLFKKIRGLIEYHTKNKLFHYVDVGILDVFRNSNPDSYLTYSTLADYYYYKKKKEYARNYYKEALLKVVPTVKEARQISECLQKVEKELNDENAKQ